MLFYEQTDGQEVNVNVALPVAEEPPGLPPPAHFRVLPAIEAAAAVRSGLAASIYPMVYQDLAAWVQAHGYQPNGPGRDIWLHEVDDISEADQQVFEAQLPFTRPPAST
jgi:effector-binding domain-containing protein